VLLVNSLVRFSSDIQDSDDEDTSEERSIREKEQEKNEIVKQNAANIFKELNDALRAKRKAGPEKAEPSSGPNEEKRQKELYRSSFSCRGGWDALEATLTSNPPPKSPRIIHTPRETSHRETIANSTAIPIITTSSPKTQEVEFKALNSSNSIPALLKISASLKNGTILLWIDNLFNKEKKATLDLMKSIPNITVVPLNSSTAMFDWLTKNVTSSSDAKRVKVVTNNYRVNDFGDRAGEMTIKTLRKNNKLWKTIPAMIYCGNIKAAKRIAKNFSNVSASNDPVAVMTFASK